MFRFSIRWVPAAFLATALCAPLVAWSAPDPEAARMLARQNKCFDCHSVSRKGDGPAWKEVAAKYRGKPDGQARLLTHLTTSPKVKMPDGREEEHKAVRTTDKEQVKNLVDWILSL